MVNIDSNIVPQTIKQGKVLNPGVIRTYNAYAIIGILSLSLPYFNFLTN